MKRPLLWVALFHVCGILISRYIPLSPYPLLAASGCVTIVAFAWSRARLYLLYALCVLTGCTNYSLHTAIISPFDIRRLLGQEPAIASIRGVLLETPTERVFVLGEKESWSSVAQIRLTELRTNGGAWAPAEGIIAITTLGTISTNYFGGQPVEIIGVAARPKIAAAEGTFDYRAYLADKGIYYQLRVSSDKDWQLCGPFGTPPVADRFRAWAKRALALGMPEEDEPLRLEWALTLGWKQAMTEEISEPFVRAATYHIFAVDGLRMAIISGIFFALLRALRVPRAACALILLPIIWFYTALTGWPASAIRANIMLTIVIMGWVLKRPSDTMNSLYAAAIVILLWQPSQLFQAGFQLSFVVVFYIIIALTALERFRQRLTLADPLLPDQLRPKWRKFLDTVTRVVLELFSSSLAAWVASLPLVALYFHIVTPVSTPANMVAVPACGLVLICNLSSLLVAGWLPAAAEIFNHAGWGIMWFIQKSSQWFEKWPAAYYYVPQPALITTYLYYLVLLALVTGWLFKPKLRQWRIAALAVVLGGCGWHYWQNSNLTRLSLLPVNGGMALYFHAPGSKDDLMIDGGNSNAVQFITKPFLRAQGVNRLPTLALTHGDLRHVGGAELVGNLFAVPKVYVSPVRFRSPVYRKILKDWSATTNKLQTVTRTNRVGPWTVLHPNATDRFPQADDNALVLDGTFHGCRILLLSDLGRPGQEALLERNPNLRADIVVTGLPVQNEPICDALLDAIQPRLIVVVDSEFPPLERASLALHQRLALRKTPVVYTRADGATTIEWRDKGWELKTTEGTRITSDHLTELPDPVLEQAKAQELFE